MRKTIDENVELRQTVPEKVEYLHKLQELLEIEPPPLEDTTEDTQDNTDNTFSTTERNYTKSCNCK